jgi:lambda family phage portal protein
LTGYIETEAGVLIPESPYRSTSRSNPAVEHWNPPDASADEAILPALSALRNQSHDLDRNEAIARGAVENTVSNVVADGLRPQAKLDHQVLGIPEQKAREFEKAAERIFALHASSVYSDFTRSNPFGINQAIALRSVLLDGDCLILKRYKPGPGAILGTCIQIIEGSRLRNPDFGGADKDIREGVELNEDGEAVAYHIVNRDRLQTLQPERTIRIPRFDADGNPIALHVFHSRLPGQTRGEPFLAPVVERFKQLSRYTESEIMAAVISAFFSVFVTSEGHGPFGDRKDIHLASRQANMQTRSKEKFGSGMLLNMLPGEKVETLTPGRPNANYQPFIQAVLQQIGMGLSIPFEVLTQNFQSSYTAARAALLEAWKFVMIRRAWTVSKICQPFYEWALGEAVAKGMLSAPDFSNVVKRRIYTSAEWVGPSMPSIDRLKDAKADETRLSTQTASRRSIVEGEGRDFEKLQREIASEQPDKSAVDVTQSY